MNEPHFFLKLRTDDLLSLLIGQDVYSNVSANVPADLAIAAGVTNSICRRRSRPEEGRWLLPLFAKGKGNMACNFDLYSHMEHRSSSIALRSRQLLCVKVCYAIMLTQDRERKRENVGANHLFKYVLWSAFCRARRASPPYALSLWVRRLGGGLSLPHRSRRRILYIKITPAETSYIYIHIQNCDWLDSRQSGGRFLNASLPFMKRCCSAMCTDQHFCVVFIDGFMYFSYLNIFFNENL